MSVWSEPAFFVLEPRTEPIKIGFKYSRPHMELNTKKNRQLCISSDGSLGLFGFLHAPSCFTSDVCVLDCVLHVDYAVHYLL